MAFDLAIKSKRILTPDGLVPGTLVIKGGTIHEVITNSETTLENVEDMGDWVVMPGLIDSHVHINEPGRTEWEGFETATMAAAAGGVTTLIEMPLNSNPVTTSAEHFNQKIEAAKGKLYVNCGFWGGFIPKSINHLEELLTSGIWGIKVFLTHSGINEFPNVSKEDLLKAMPIIRKYQLPLLVHAEINQHQKDCIELINNPKSYQSFLGSRPSRMEDEAIELMIQLCRQFETPVHIVHLSSSQSLTQLKSAKDDNISISVETCPHYLLLNSESIPDASTVYKCAPPIRSKENQEKLWSGLKDGVIDFIVSDHSPAPPEKKKIDEGNFETAWGGIASLQFSLPLLWTEASKRGFNIQNISDWMSKKVTDFIGLNSYKGRIATGYDADLVVWSPEEKFTLTSDKIYFKHKITPYLDHQLKGVVQKTYVAGKKVFDQGDFISLPTGQVLLK